jgi:hypothetical protein
MSENRSGADGGKSAGTDGRASSPSRRRILKAAAASAPIIMSIKARPAYSQTPDQPQTEQNSHTMSSNLSQRPGIAAR